MRETDLEGLVSFVWRCSAMDANADWVVDVHSLGSNEGLDGGVYVANVAGLDRDGGVDHLKQIFWWNVDVPLGDASGVEDWMGIPAVFITTCLPIRGLQLRVDRRDGDVLEFRCALRTIDQSPAIIAFTVVEVGRRPRLARAVETAVVRAPWERAIWSTPPRAAHALSTSVEGTNFATASSQVGKASGWTTTGSGVKNSAKCLDGRVQTDHRIC
mmetsp:Transcript_29915/g.70363  ORF Transcript_29915/g.70363 Transcript_29915/m.70363 type:complete len:214 (+) Transcript_29915:365-1006(+)